MSQFQRVLKVYILEVSWDLDNVENDKYNVQWHFMKVMMYDGARKLQEADNETCFLSTDTCKEERMDVDQQNSLVWGNHVQRNTIHWQQQLSNDQTQQQQIKICL